MKNSYDFSKGKRGAVIATRTVDVTPTGVDALERQTTEKNTPSNPNDYLPKEGNPGEVSANGLTKQKRLKLAKWNVIDHLHREDVIAGYLAACDETKDAALIQAAATDALQARAGLQMQNK